MGVMARWCNPEVFAAVKPIVAEMAMAKITAEDAMSPENVSQTEHAVSAMGKLAMFQGMTELTPKFLEMLPMKNLEDEA